MKRSASLLLLLAGLNGCVSIDGGGEGPPGPGPQGHAGGPPPVPGVQGPWGQPVPMRAPYAYKPPSSLGEARSMMAQSLPLELVQTAAAEPPSPNDIMQAQCPPGGCPPFMMASPPGMPFGPGAPPGMGGGPGMFPSGPPAGAVAASGALTGSQPSFFPTHRTSVRFVGPAGMKVSWFAMGADGKPGFTPTQLETPGRYNFSQAAIYRLKLTNIPNRPGLELYPTLEIVPSGADRSIPAHSSVPLAFTEEDFEQVASGNYVIKVIYLPSPQFQDLATTGPDEVVSSRLEPGVDPIGEAHRRGNILAVIRMGNIDLEAPNTPSMDAPNPNQPKKAPAGPGASMPSPGPGMAGMAPPGMGGPPGPMVPYEAFTSNRPLSMGPGTPPLIMGPQGLMMLTPQGPVPVGPNGPMPMNQPKSGGAPGTPGAMLPPPTPGAPGLQQVTPPKSGPVASVPPQSNPVAGVPLLDGFQQTKFQGQEQSQAPEAAPATNVQVEEPKVPETSQTLPESSQPKVAAPEQAKFLPASAPAPGAATKPSFGRTKSAKPADKGASWPLFDMIKSKKSK